MAFALAEVKAVSQLSDDELRDEQRKTLRQWRYYDAADDIHAWQRETDDRELCHMYLEDLKAEMARRGLPVDYRS